MAEVFFFEGDDALIQFKDFFGRLVEVLIVVATLVIGSGGDGHGAVVREQVCGIYFIYFRQFIQPGNGPLSASTFHHGIGALVNPQFSCHCFLG